jgi:hypothetical protein
MMRTYADLISSDPFWPQVAASAASASSRVTVLPCNARMARACLEALQVTTRSALGALAHETGGLLVDHGWLRVFGSGHPKLTRTLGGWNAQLGIPLEQLLIVADDAVGGVFAINGGALGPTRGSVYYFAPDTLRWENLELGHAAFVQWVIEHDLTTFYQHLRWPGWESDVSALGGDQALSLYPPPWSAEGKDVAKVARGVVPAAELWLLQMEMVAQLVGRGES